MGGNVGKDCSSENRENLKVWRVRCNSEASQSAKEFKKQHKKARDPEIKAFSYMKGRRSLGNSVGLLDDQGAKDVLMGKKGDLEAQWTLCFGLCWNIEISSVIMSFEAKR